MDTIATIIVGLLAFSVYFLGKRDKKKNAAKIIVAELGGAEDQIKAVRTRFAESDGKDLGSSPVLTSNSWKKYRQLFINNFTEKQWRKIGQFYEDCETLDEAIAVSKSFFGHNSQAIRTERYKAAASFTAKAVNRVESGEFSVQGADGSNEVPEGTGEKITQLVENKLNAFNQILETALNNAGGHYNPLKPMNDADMLFKHMTTEVLDTEIGIVLRKIAKRKF